MADDEAQGQEDSSWPAFEASTGSSLPPASFEPLVWPESTTWGEPPAWEPGDDPVLAQAPPPDLEVQWQATGRDAGTTVHHDQALAGLGGGAEVAAPGADSDIGLISTSALPTPPIYPAAERSAQGPRWRRFDIRQGNAVVVGLISLVSLVLLGMFLSVRARNEVPTDSSQSRRPSDEISVTGSLNTIPPTTTVTTTVTTAAINIADLLPTLDAGAAPTGDATASDTASGSGSGSGLSATTAAPSRGGAASGGGAGGEPTKAATQAPAPTSPPAASPTVEDSPPEDTVPPPVDNPQPRRPTPTFDFPSFPQPTAAPDDDGPSYTFPSWSDIDD